MPGDNVADLGMAVTPAYSKAQVRRAGRVLRDMATDPAPDLDSVQFWDAVGVVDWWRARHAKPLARTNVGLRYYVRKVQEAPDVTQRLKRFSTIVSKLVREPTMQLSNMEDIAGVRAVLPTQRHVDLVVDELVSQPRWKIRRIRHYVSGRDPGPKADGYRAVHVVVAKDGCFVEIQLRTPWQDAWAQSVEQDTRRLRAGLKFGVGPADLREYYRVAAEYMETRELDAEPAQELLEELSKLFRATRQYYPEREDQ